MQHQKNKKRNPKKRKKNIRVHPGDYHYQKDNPLTVYFAKLIEKKSEIK